MIGWYWILKLKAQFMLGDFADALVAADKAKPLLDASVGQVAVLDYYLYTALTVSALYDTASVDEQRVRRELLKVRCQEQLREWAENYSPTFGDKYTLVMAETARLEKRYDDAHRLYEQAIRAAREHGFVANEPTRPGSSRPSARSCPSGAASRLLRPPCKMQPDCSMRRRPRRYWCSTVPSDARRSEKLACWRNRSRSGCTGVEFTTPGS